jgi:ATP-dependent DNA ligase
MIKLVDRGVPFRSGFINAKLDDPELQELLWAYKRRVAGNYKPLSPDEIALLPTGRYLVSEKLDGELWFLVVSKGNAYLVNPYGRVIHGALPILAAASSLADGTVLAGELYIRREGARARVGDLAAYFANPGTPGLQELSFCAFDLVRGQDDVQEEPYEKRHRAIESFLANDQAIHAVNHTVLESAAEISSVFADRVVGGGAEGLVLRTASGLVYKLKQEIEIDALVVAYTTRVDSPDQARSVLLALAIDNDLHQIIGGCGNLGTDENRVSILKKLAPHSCNSAVRVSSETGGLYRFVRPSVIVQVKVTDLQSDRSDGSPSLGHKIRLSEKGWSSLGMSPTARLIHPVMLRIRDDKSVNSQDLRFSQLSHYVKLDQLAVSSDTSATKSDLLRRDVWLKETKGIKAVRKLLVWKTNKETVNPSMPAYVVHWTDYSPSRASPLDREVKLAPTREIALAIADQLVEENIKKGWEKV